jgi:hypothetical protein
MQRASLEQFNNLAGDYKPVGQLDLVPNVDLDEEELKLDDNNDYYYDN